VTGLSHTDHYSEIPAPTADYVQAALEASCAVLVALESLHARARGTVPESRAVRGNEIAEAIGSLRLVIEQLRLAADVEASMLALGFVRPA
jgi:hypothetical protein